MTDPKTQLSRRDFVKGAGCAALGFALGLPVFAEEEVEQAAKTRVVLVRHKEAVDAKGKVHAEIIQQMMDDAVVALLEEQDPKDCWRKMITPKDIVGIKSNEWGNLPTPPELEKAIEVRVREVGVPEKHIAIDDRGVLGHPVFQKATALVNVRPLRTHAWSGVGSLIKNYIMFSPEPPKYHPDSCANLATLWELPAVKGKTRLNILVLLTPLFHGSGWHHFDPTFVWPYRGLLMGTDPVAVDSVGLRIFQAKRRAYFGEDRPLSPPAHHIVLADKKYHLGTSDPAKIELIRLGWDEDVLI
jgi:hypothetical protein